MVGNSVRSDILPVLELGPGRARALPHHLGAGAGGAGPGGPDPALPERVAGPVGSLVRKSLKLSQVQRRRGVDMGRTTQTLPLQPAHSDSLWLLDRCRAGGPGGTTDGARGDGVSRAGVGRSTATRSVYLDAFRAVALVHVVVYHASSWSWVTAFTAMPLMFFIAGTLYAASLERRDASRVVRDRYRRILVPYWVYLAAMVALWASLGVLGEITPANWVGFILPVLSVNGPRDQGADTALHLTWFALLVHPDAPDPVAGRQPAPPGPAEPAPRALRRARPSCSPCPRWRRRAWPSPSSTPCAGSWATTTSTAGSTPPCAAAGRWCVP